MEGCGDERTSGTWRCGDVRMRGCGDTQGCEDASTDPTVPITEQTHLTQSLMQLTGASCLSLVRDRSMLTACP